MKAGKKVGVFLAVNLFLAVFLEIFFKKHFWIIIIFSGEERGDSSTKTEDRRSKQVLCSETSQTDLRD